MAGKDHGLAVFQCETVTPKPAFSVSPTQRRCRNASFPETTLLTSRELPSPASTTEFHHKTVPRELVHWDTQQLSFSFGYCVSLHLVILAISFMYQEIRKRNWMTIEGRVRDI